MIWALPIVVIGLILLPGISGCDPLEKLLGRKEEEPRCSTAPKQASWQQIDDDAYAAFDALWLSDPDGPRDEPWMRRLLEDPRQPFANLRPHFGAATRLFRPICAGTVLSGKEELAQYRAAVTAFFRSYVLQRADPAHESLLVMLAGLAPADAGETVVLGGLNALNLPTEPKSIERDQTMQFTQLLKAAYFFNVAAERADHAFRFSIARPHGTLVPRDRVVILDQLRAAERIFSPINPQDLNERQRPCHRVLKAAMQSLKQSVS
jgi:hypothetical protein